MQSVERGATRSALVKRCGIAKASLVTGYKNMGRRHSMHARRSMETAIKEGKMTLSEAKTPFNLKSVNHVKQHLRRADKEKAELRRMATLMEKNEARPEAISSEDTAALKKTLKEAELKIKALNTLIDVVEEQFKIPVRKKTGARQS